MEHTVLVTTGKGMFGGATIHHLLGRPGVRVRALVRDPAGLDLSAANLEVVVADLDRPETLGPALEGVTDVFLVTPMGDRVADRELAVLAAAQQAGEPRIVKLAGAVRHDPDALASQHTRVLSELKDCGLRWTLVSPNSVMETSLLNYAEMLRYGCILGMSGDGRIGLVALDDCAKVAAVVLSTDGHDGCNYELTGPDALDLTEVAAVFSDVLGRSITYIDIPEASFAAMLKDHGGYSSDEELEINVLCHLRAWREGRADLVTDTVEQVTGDPPTPLAVWIEDHRDVFDVTPTLGDRLAGFMLRHKYAG